LECTTGTPEAWTLGSSPWIVSNPTAGTGSDHLAFSIDATGLLPGPLSGSAVVSAPSTVDGGATLPVTAELHPDPRTSDLITIGTSSEGGAEVRVATDGIGTMVFWLAEDHIFTARLDGGTGVSPTVQLVPGPLDPPDPVELGRTDLDVTTDGRDVLLAWIEQEGESWSVRTMRVGPDGQALDTP